MSIFSLMDLEPLLQRNRSVVEESENITEALAKQREKCEQLQVSYSDPNIVHTVTLLPVITMADHARLECAAMQKETWKQ